MESSYLSDTIRTQVTGLVVHCLPALGMRFSSNREISCRINSDSVSACFFKFLQSSQAAATVKLAADLYGIRTVYLSRACFLFSWFPLVFYPIEFKVPRFYRWIYERTGPISQVVFIVSELAIFFLTKNPFAIGGALFAMHGLLGRLLILEDGSTPLLFSKATNQFTHRMSSFAYTFGHGSLVGQSFGLFKFLVN